MIFVLVALIKEKLRLNAMKKYQKGLYQDFVEEVREHAPKGYLQPLYDLVSKRIRISSSTASGQKGADAVLSSVSQDYDQHLGFSILVLRFEGGANINIPLPPKVLLIEPGKVLLDFARTSSFDDVANPYRKMRRNLKGYATEDQGNEPKVLIEVITD